MSIVQPTPASDIPAMPTAVEFAEIEPDDRNGRSLLVENLDIVKNVSVKLHVRAGETTLSVGELLALREGQIVKLDSELSSPLQILLDGQVIASGELMAVGEHFGVRIVDAVRHD